MAHDEDDRSSRQSNKETSVKGKRAAIYARVSTDDQSPQMQLDAVRDLAKHRGFDVVAEHVDIGYSGAKESRPELNRLLDAARKGKLDIIICFRLDRIGRSLKHLVLLMEELRALNVDLLSYSENIDTSTPIGTFTYHLISALAQMEREIIKSRCVEGQKRAALRGTVLGRPKASVDAVRVVQLRKDGKSLREIGKALGVGRNVVSRVLDENRIEVSGGCPESPASTASA
jgi:DNA invertase Pin-like site-specific DNA recombinase